MDASSNDALKTTPEHLLKVLSGTFARVFRWMSLQHYLRNATVLNSCICILASGNVFRVTHRGWASDVKDQG